MHDSSDDPRIKELIGAILRTATGAFDTYLEPSSQRDGIDAIIAGFNAMSARLSELYGRLDEQVTRRTAQLESAGEQLRILAYTDPLTGLANRSELGRHLDSRLAAVSRGEPASTLLVLDLDSFKLINDTHGHHLGDQVLQELTRRMRDIVRDTDLVARLGGDEFALLVHLPDSEAPGFAERLLAGLNQPMLLESIVVNPGVSIGYAPADAALDAEQWIRQADTAMYEAKRSKTDKVQRFAQHMLVERITKSRLIADLRNAVRTEEIYADYLPIVDLASSRVLAYKARARWDHPEDGLIPPETFVPLAKEAGLLPAVRHRMVRSTLADFASWRRSAQISADCRLHLNINHIALREDAFTGQLAEQLAELELPAGNLVLEVTEGHFISEDGEELRNMHRLKELGIKVFLDKFGAGYSSFGYLARLPISGIKLDKSLTNGIHKDPVKLEVLRAIVSMADALELECVAVAVRTDEQAQALQALGVRNAQGYHVGASAKRA